MLKRNYEDLEEMIDTIIEASKNNPNLSNDGLKNAAMYWVTRNLEESYEELLGAEEEIEDFRDRNYAMKEKYDEGRIE